MAKQKCGSCYFFEEAGLAGSGWCHHPQRKVSSDVMIMVRRNELACRDGWSRSLWQPSLSPEDDTSQPLFVQPRVGHPGTSEPRQGVPAADDLHVSFPVETDGEDVLLSEGRIVAEPREIDRATTPRPTPAGFDPRSAIFRAREAYRERVRARSAAARQSAGLEALANPPAERDAADEWPESTELGPPEDPPPGGAPLPDRDRLVIEAAPPEPVVASPPAPPLLAAVRAVTEQVTGRGDVAHRADQAEIPAETPNAPTATSASRLEIDHVEWAAPRAPDDGRFPQNAALPDWFRTDLPRICRACRDYRPSGDGERGWCGNAWAFTTRRLVQGHDVAPCQSAIGDWWVPVDDVWLVAADVSAHGRPTPLLDRFSSPERKERRRS